MLPKNPPIKYTDRMSKKLAIFDIDGTLFRWQLYHELIYRLKDQGYFSAGPVDIARSATTKQK
jgi:FMN phosphatase YigB (HAD superfamily)